MPLTRVSSIDARSKSLKDALLVCLQATELMCAVTAQKLSRKHESIATFEIPKVVAFDGLAIDVARRITHRRQSEASVGINLAWSAPPPKKSYLPG